MKQLIGDLQIQDGIAIVGFLILVFLVVNNWQGVNALVSTGGRVAVSGIRTLQGR